MLDNKLQTIEINGTAYPYKCDMVVLEKIQKEYGDLLRYEYGIRGVVPYFDENGARDAKKDKYITPDVGMTCRSIIWMIEEGIDIAGEDLTPPTEKEIKRQQDFTVNELAMMAFEEYANCFLSAMSKAQKSRKGTKKKYRKKKR